MPADRVRVRPPHRHTGLMILAAVYGMACALLVVLLQGLLVVLSGNIGPGWWIVIAQTILVLAPPFLGAGYVVRCCQHPRFVFFIGFIMGGCYVLALTGAVLVVQTAWQGWVIPRWEDLLWVTLTALLCGTFGGGIYLLLLAVYRNFVAVLVEQDGTLCSTCGYCIAHAPSPRCPECGTSRDTPTRTNGRLYAFSEWLGRRCWWLAATATMGVILLSLSVEWYRGPLRSFDHRFGGSPRAYTVHAGAGTTQATVRAMEHGLAIPEDPQDRLLIVQLYRPSRLSDPRLQLRLGTETKPNQGNPWMVVYSRGYPRVVCDLTREQTRTVLRSGIPDGLIEALTDAAEQVGWLPDPPDPSEPHRPDVIVSAEPYFPNRQ